MVIAGIDILNVKDSIDLGKKEKKGVFGEESNKYRRRRELGK